MGKKTVSIILLNYKGLKDTLECINSLKRIKTNNLSVEIVVVDNGSGDESVKVLKNVPNIKLLVNNKNSGYSGGNNLGIKFALKGGADYILILNNDTVVDVNFLVNLISAAKSADIIAPKIYFAPGFEFHKSRYKKEDIGKVIWFAGANIDWGNILGQHIGVDEVDNGQFSNPREIQFATGACMFVKSDVFKKIGLLDEKYFLYLEDMDFCTRAARFGFKIIYEPSAVIWHKNASSAGGSGSQIQNYFITRNRLLFAFKYAPFKNKILLLKHVIFQVSDKTRRKALFDFLTFNFGRGSFTI